MEEDTLTIWKQIPAKRSSRTCSHYVRHYLFGRDNQKAKMSDKCRFSKSAHPYDDQNKNNRSLRYSFANRGADLLDNHVAY